MRKNRVRFNLTNIKSNPLIRVIYRYGHRLMLDWSSGLNVSVDDWKHFNKTIQRFDGKRFQSINNDLNAIEAAVYEIEGKYKATKKLSLLTTDLFKQLLDNHIKGIDMKENRDSVAWFIQYIIDNRTSFNISDDTVENYRAFLTLFKNFIQRYKFKDLSFDDIDSVLFDKFLRYMHELNHQDSSIRTRVGYFKSILSKAFDRKYTKNIDFKRFKVSSHKGQRKMYAYFNDSEFSMYENCDLSGLPPKYQEAKDVSLALAYTGLRVKDYPNINLKNLINENGYDELKFKTSKRGVWIRQPVTPQLKTILYKYHKGLPNFSRDLLGYYIKQIADISGINSEHPNTQSKGRNPKVSHVKKSTVFSPHTFRRNFITKRMSEGYSDQQVMLMVGITKIETLHKYFVATEQEIAQSNAVKMRVA